MPNERDPDSSCGIAAKVACVSLLLLSHTHGQQPSSTSDQAAGVTRASEIAAEREQKERQLAAELNSRWEDRVIYVRESRLLERFTAGVAGFRVKLGGLASGGGFAAGPEYLRTDLADGAVTFQASAQASLRKFQKYDVELNVPRLATRWISWNVYAVHHNYPQLQYYGSGQDSEKTGRSDFRLEDTAVDTTLALHSLPRLTLAGQLGYLQNNVGPGTSSRFISTDQQFTEATTPGISKQADFVRYGAFVQYDYRDRPAGARSGGMYFAQWARYIDQTLGAFSHHRFDIEAQQFIPLFNARRVIALRGRTSLTSDGDRIPFYMQPVVGGSETVRGFRHFRFYGNNSMVMNAEYRYEVFSGLDMAIFADAGKVADRKRDIHFRNLESSVGFGFRFNVRNNVFLRVDTAFSHEGFQVWFKFNNVFSTGPVKTSSSQGEF